MARLTPYLILLALLTPFKGFSQEQPQPPSINIGLLVPDRSHTNVIRAAEMAIAEANLAGEYQNGENKLVIGTTEGPWGAGSKESVSLVYDHQVCVILGSLDGRNGHLAEQVASKSQLAYIETFATEPTLSQAFVPWFMRIVPNDNQQAQAIIRLILQNGGGKSAILSTELYDTRYAVKSLTQAFASNGGTPPLIMEVDPTDPDWKELSAQIAEKQIDHLVIPFDARIFDDLIPYLRAITPAMNIYGTLHFTMGTEQRDRSWSAYEGVSFVGSHYLFTDTGQPFRKLYREKYGQEPGHRAAYMYDAVRLVIHAIGEAGPERGAIRAYLSETEFSGGITGPISFDALGNRNLIPAIFRIEQGVPQTIKLR